MVNSKPQCILPLHRLLHLLFTQCVKPTSSLLREQARSCALTKARKVPRRGTSSLAALPTPLPRFGIYVKPPSRAWRRDAMRGTSPAPQFSATRLGLRLASGVGSAAELQA